MKIGVIVMPTYRVGMDIKWVSKGPSRVSAPRSVWQMWVLILFCSFVKKSTPDAVGWKKKTDIWTTLPCQHLLAQKHTKARGVREEMTFNRKHFIQPPLTDRWRIWGPGREGDFLRSTRCFCSIQTFIKCLLCPYCVSVTTLQWWISSCS